MESGPARVKRIATSYDTKLNVQVYLTSAQLQTFRTFLETDANMGADWVDIPVITTLGCVDHLCRITDVNETKMERGWFVSLTLETAEHNAS